MINKAFKNSNVGGKMLWNFFERFYKNNRTLATHSLKLCPRKIIFQVRLEYYFPRTPFRYLYQNKQNCIIFCFQYYIYLPSVFFICESKIMENLLENPKIMENLLELGNDDSMTSHCVDKRHQCKLCDKFLDSYRLGIQRKL